jgi:hypothetical protein
LNITKEAEEEVKNREEEEEVLYMECNSQGPEEEEETS